MCIKIQNQKEPIFEQVKESKNILREKFGNPKNISIVAKNIRSSENCITGLYHHTENLRSFDKNTLNPRHEDIKMLIC